MFAFCLRNAKVTPVGLLSASCWQSKLGVPSTVRIPYQQWPVSLTGSPDAKNTNLHTSSKVSTAHAEHNHTKIWTAERAVSGALVGLVPVSLIMPHPVMDYLLALALTTHIHWGVEAIVVDYVRPNVVGPVIPKIALGAVYGLSALTLGGLFYFNYTDVGLVQAIKMLWSL